MLAVLRMGPVWSLSSNGLLIKQDAVVDRRLGLGLQVESLTVSTSGGRISSWSIPAGRDMRAGSWWSERVTFSAYCGSLSSHMTMRSLSICIEYRLILVCNIIKNFRVLLWLNLQVQILTWNFCRWALFSAGFWVPFWFILQRAKLSQISIFRREFYSGQFQFCKCKF